MQKKIRTLEDKAIASDIISRQDKLEIAGVPTSASQSCEEIALQISQKVDPAIQKANVVQAFRIGKPKDHQGNANLNRPILVQYSSPRIRNAVFKNKRALKDVNIREMNFGTAEKVYINENLSNDMKFLLRQVNIRRKEKEWKFMWTNSGMIYVRKMESSNAIMVKREEDLKLIV